MSGHAVMHVWHQMQHQHGMLQKYSKTDSKSTMSFFFVSMSGATDWWEWGIQAKANWGLSWLPLQDEDCDGHTHSGDGDGDGESCHVFAMSCDVWSGSTQVCSERLHGQDRRPQQACEWNHWGQKGQEQEEVRASEPRCLTDILEREQGEPASASVPWKRLRASICVNMCQYVSICVNVVVETSLRGGPEPDPLLQSLGLHWRFQAKTSASEMDDIIGQHEDAVRCVARLWKGLYKNLAK